MVLTLHYSWVICEHWKKMGQGALVNLPLFQINFLKKIKSMGRHEAKYFLFDLFGRH